MQVRDGSLSFSPSDLSAHLACPHLTTLRAAVARGEIPRPHRENPHADLIRRKGDQHEGRYLADELSAHFGVTYSRLWMNWYRDNDDGTSWHADRPVDKLDEVVIPVLSLGATRRFLIKSNGGGRSTAIVTEGGDLVVTAPEHVAIRIPRRGRPPPRGGCHPHTEGGGEPPGVRGLRAGRAPDRVRRGCEPPPRPPCRASRVATWPQLRTLVARATAGDGSRPRVT